MTDSPKSPIRLLLSTDSPALHTGLAETTRLVFNRLLEKYPGKYNIEQIAWFHDPKGPEKVNWKLYPTRADKGQYAPQDKYGQESFDRVLVESKPDIVYSNGDLWCFDHILQHPMRNTYRFVAYYTIDGAPYWGNGFEPGKHTEWGSKLMKADEVVVLTEFGEETLKSSMPEMAKKNVEVIYHPIDANRFKPLNEEQKLERRSRIWGPGIPDDAFVLGWIGRNQFRKQNYKMWEVMHHIVHGNYITCNHCKKVTRFEWDRSKMEPREVGRLRLYDADYDYSYCWYCLSEDIEKAQPINDFWLWTHMNKSDPGWRIDDHTAMWKIKDRLVYTPGLAPAAGLAPEKLAELIATWDGLLYLSGGEGFGIPPFEGMLSGIPIIYTNYSSHADFSQHGGLPVRCDMIPEMNFGIHRAYADVNHAIEQCLWAYNNRVVFKGLGMKGRAWAEQKTLDGIVDQWDAKFTKMMEKPIGVQSTELIYGESV